MQPRVGTVTDHPFQLPATLGLTAVAPVFALPFEQIEGEQHHRHFFEDFPVQGLATDALLQEGKRLRCRFKRLFGAGWRRFPGDDFAVDHRPVGKAQNQAVQFREALGHQLFAPRPDPQAPAALDHLGADAIPFPFRLPVLDRAEQRFELLHGWRQGMGEKKRVGLAATLGVFIRGFGGDQFQVTGGAGAMSLVGITHQSLRHTFAVQTRHGCQRTGDQQFGHPDAKAAGDQFDADHQAQAIQLRPQLRQLLPERLRGFAAQWQQFVLDPGGQPVG
ncbi:hypothetical protein D3C81_1169620 [compost metagenome]